jgi:glyoxalase family protein
MVDDDLRLHHITIVIADAQRTADFYTRICGPKAGQEDGQFRRADSYHLYFGNDRRTGTAITFFEWPHAPKGRHGTGGTHHFALRVSNYDGLLKWKRRLTDLGIQVRGPFDRNYFKSIYFQDPDGVNIEIATEGPGFLIDEPEESLGSEFHAPPDTMTIANRDTKTIEATIWPEPVGAITPDMALMRGMHHISAISSNIERTHDFYNGLLGMKRVKMTANFDDPDSAHWYWGVENGKPGTVITYFEHDPHKTRQAQMVRIDTISLLLSRMKMCNRCINRYHPGRFPFSPSWIASISRAFTPTTLTDTS